MYDYDDPNGWYEQPPPMQHDDGGKMYWPDGTPWAPTPDGRPNDGANFDPPTLAGPLPPPEETTPNTPLPVPVPRPNPNPNPNPGPSGGGRVPGTTEYPIAGGAKSFSYPDWLPPDIAFGTFAAPSFDVQPWNYADFEGELDVPDFEGPTAENFQADPGYDFRMKEMLRGITNQRSAQGLLATGGTLAELMSYAGGLASQELGNVFNRKHQGYVTNRDTALARLGEKRKTYDTNRGNQADIWNKNYMAESDEFTRSLTDYLTKEQAKEAEWERSRTLYGTNLGKEASSYGLNLDTSQLNLARDNSNFANTLSLYNIMTRTMPTYQPAA